MKLSLSKEQFLPALQKVIGAVERRQTIPILSNALITVANGVVSITATDTEIELYTTISDIEGEEGQCTIPARKLLEIVKNLKDNAKLTIETQDNKAILKSNRSRFTVATLPANEFP